MSYAPLFPRKELASLFLSVDHSRLTADVIPDANSQQPLPLEEAERFLNAKNQALNHWRDSVSTQYRHAFERSNRVNAETERQNFKELKRIYQSGVALHAFLKVLLDGQHNSQEEVGEKLKELKKESQRLTVDNASLATSLAAQHEELTNVLAELREELRTVGQLRPLGGAMEQSSREQLELQAALNKAEQEHMELMSMIGSQGSKMSDVDDEIRRETTECALLRDLISKKRQEAMSKNDERDRMREDAEQHSKEMESIANLLKAIGGTDVIEMTGNRLMLSMKTDTAKSERGSNRRTFIHRLSLELHPTTLRIEGARLEPDEGIMMDSLVGEELKAAISAVRSLLFLSLTQRTHLESIQGVTFVRVDPARGVWRAALTDRIEVEFVLPSNWPHEKNTQVRLLDVQSAVLSAGVAYTRDKIRPVLFDDPSALFNAVLHSLREQGTM